MTDKLANTLKEIEAVDRLLDAGMAALFMRVHCQLRDYAGFQTAYNRNPDLEVRRDALVRQRGRLQLERDRLEHQARQREQRRERARQRKIKTPMPSVYQYATSIGDLERLAGVEDRAAFWLPFAKHDDGFQRGVAALTAMIQTRMQEAA